MAAPGAAFIPASPGGTSAFPPDQVTKAVSTLDKAGITADLDAAAEGSGSLQRCEDRLAQYAERVMQEHPDSAGIE